MTQPNTSGFEETLHVPVLVREAIRLLGVREGGTYVDGTIGAGGHAAAILKAGGARVIGIDRDPDAVALAGTRFAGDAGAVSVCRGNFADLEALLDRLADDFRRRHRLGARNRTLCGG